MGTNSEGANPCVLGLRFNLNLNLNKFPHLLRSRLTPLGCLGELFLFCMGKKFFP